MHTFDKSIAMHLFGMSIANALQNANRVRKT